MPPKRTTPSQEAEDLGLIKVSIKVETRHENNSFVLVMSFQEWYQMRDVLNEDARAGFKGKFFTLPKGVNVLLARVDKPASLPAQGTL